MSSVSLSLSAMRGLTGIILLLLFYVSGSIGFATNQTINVSEGQDVTLNCVTNNAPVTWTRDGVTLIQTTPLWNITAVQRGSTGVYKCFEGNIERAVIHLIVEYPPMFSVRNVKLKVDELQIVRLVCAVKTVPTANLTWLTTDGLPVVPSNRHVILPACGPGSSTLLVAMGTTDKHVQYTCTARNKLGFDTKIFRITTNYKAPSPGWGSREEIAGLCVGLMLTILIALAILFHIMRAHRRIATRPRSPSQRSTSQDSIIYPSRQSEDILENWGREGRGYLPQCNEVIDESPRKSSGRRNYRKRSRSVDEAVARISQNDRLPIRPEIRPPHDPPSAMFYYSTSIV